MLIKHGGFRFRAREDETLIRDHYKEVDEKKLGEHFLDILKDTDLGLWCRKDISFALLGSHVDFARL